VRIYIEGGFEPSTKANCRRAFRAFFEKVVPLRSPLQVIACGDRASAFQDFCSAVREHPGDFVILLVDAEEAVHHTSWQHLRERVGDQWRRPNGVTDDQAQLMVQVMEAWFFADRDGIARYYGQKFLRKSLPGQPNIELISKRDVYDSLRHATSQTQKGEYHKTRHAFELLELIDPSLVRAASVHANRLLEVLERELAH